MDKEKLQNEIELIFSVLKEKIKTEKQWFEILNKDISKLDEYKQYFESSNLNSIISILDEFFEKYVDLIAEYKNYCLDNYLIIDSIPRDKDNIFDDEESKLNE